MDKRSFARAGLGQGHRRFLPQRDFRLRTSASLSCGTGSSPTRKSSRAAHGRSNGTDRTDRTGRSGTGESEVTMASYNKVILMGNLTRDPNCAIPQRHAVARIGLAVNRVWRTETREQKEEVTFWNRRLQPAGRTIAQYMKKGSPSWWRADCASHLEDKQTSRNRGKLRVTLETSGSSARRRTAVRAPPRKPRPRPAAAAPAEPPPRPPKRRHRTTTFRSDPQPQPSTRFSVWPRLSHSHAQLAGLGAESDHVKVAAGYARNYSTPGLAIPVSAP